ncbi:MAG: PAS domain-containing sensor histidine kinase [Dehalococcoidales bacterium]|nr:PAS domain-containing sensor histidine kinase [Dehalococcoidales bacterium]
MTKDQLDLNEYRDICENASDIIQSVTPEGRFRYVNNAWLRILGYSWDELKDKTIFDIIHPEEIEHCRELFRTVMSGEEVNLVETRFVSRSGHTIIVEGNVNCLFNDGVPVYTRAIFRDITRLVETERVVKRLYERERSLRESLEREIQQRAEFSRILVHELKTPLTSILGLVDLLNLSQQKPPYDRAIASLNRSAAELNERISELLELTKSEIGGLSVKPRRMSSLKFINDVVKDFEPLVTGNKKMLKVEVPGTLSYVKGDRKRLRQVLQNLMDNALKATSEGGTITVRAADSGDEVTIQVMDTGYGIQPKELKNIFEPYYRVQGTAEGYGGLGLGLTLSKRIVELHGGRIWVESEPGKGSTFSFSLQKSGR